MPSAISIDIVENSSSDKTLLLVSRLGCIGVDHTLQNFFVNMCNLN